jgi:hypothetical protein
MRNHVRMADVTEPGSWKVVQSVYVEEDDGMEDVEWEKPHDTEAEAKAFAWTIFKDENPGADHARASWQDDEEDTKTLWYEGGDANIRIEYVDADGYH